MRSLPGFYFDTARQRYFPESSRPKSIPTAATPARPKQTLRSRHQKGHTPLNINASIVQTQRSYSKSTRDKTQHSVISQQIASTSSSFPMPVPIVYDAPITSLCISRATPEQDQARRTVSVGDRQGFCYANISDLVLAEHHLFSEITSIQASNEIVVYTSFGPAPRILIRNVSSQEACILRPSYLHDVRASQLQDRSLTLGMQGRALHIIDIDNPRSTSSFITHSDVFSLHRDHNDVWTGARNGVVQLFDLRTSQEQSALGGRSKYASVAHLRRIREYHLLVAATDGSLNMFDVRMVRRTKLGSAAALPIQSFDGHANAPFRLGLAVDQLDEFLFAAGDDSMIRAWSLRTGQRLQPPLTTDWSGLLTRQFASPVRAMQVSSDGHMGTLWVASGPELECFELGKRRSPDMS